MSTVATRTDLGVEPLAAPDGSATSIKVTSPSRSRSSPVPANCLCRVTGFHSRALSHCPTLPELYASLQQQRLVVVG